MNLESETGGTPGMEGNGSVTDPEKLIESIDSRLRSLSRNQGEIADTVEDLQEQNEALIEVIEMLAIGQLWVFEKGEMNENVQFSNLADPLREADADLEGIRETLEKARE